MSILFARVPYYAHAVKEPKTQCELLSPANYINTLTGPNMGARQLVFVGTAISKVGLQLPEAIHRVLFGVQTPLLRSWTPEARARY